MKLNRPTAASNSTPSSAAPVAVQAQATAEASPLPSWVARTSLESGCQTTNRHRHGQVGSGRLSVSAGLRALRDPQSWITAIAVLTLVGLSGGVFEAEDSHSERSAIHLHSGMTNDAVVAELSSQQR